MKYPSLIYSIKSSFNFSIVRFLNAFVFTSFCQLLHIFQSCTFVSFYDFICTKNHKITTIFEIKVEINCFNFYLITNSSVEIFRKQMLSEFTNKLKSTPS